MALRLAFVCLTSFALVTGAPNWECPTNFTGAGICIDECTVDSNCGGGNRRCCFNGCGNVCLGPYPGNPDCSGAQCGSPNCHNPVWVPGICCPLCPGQGPSDEGSCLDTFCSAPPCLEHHTITLPGHCCPICIEDGQCLFGTSGLCAGNGGDECGFEAECMFVNPFTDGLGSCCYRVRGAKKGRCPRKFDLKHCKKECKSDYDCSGVAKCCFNGCANVCVKPKSYCCLGGEKYVDGESFPHPDGCNNCYCDEGTTVCTLIDCGDDFPKI